jgi:hypothetical protein
MATYTYNESLPTDKDWVRLNIGDRDVSGGAETAVFSDEEIVATLTEEPNRWLAAARLGSILLTQYAGLVRKRVEDLELEVSDTDGGKGVYEMQISKLRERGARELLKRTGAHSLRVVGSVRLS